MSSSSSSSSSSESPSPMSSPDNLRFYRKTGRLPDNFSLVLPRHEPEPEPQPQPQQVYNYPTTQYVPPKSSLIYYPVYPVEGINGQYIPGYYLVPGIINGAPLNYFPYPLTQTMLQYNAFPSGFFPTGAFFNPTNNQKGFYDANNRIYFPSIFTE